MAIHFHFVGEVVQCFGDILASFDYLAHRFEIEVGVSDENHFDFLYLLQRMIGINESLSDILETEVVFLGFLPDYDTFFKGNGRYPKHYLVQRDMITNVINLSD